MDATQTPKPHVISDDGKIVTVMTAQGDTVPLDRDNPMHAEMINTFEQHGMAGEDSPAAHVAAVQADAAAAAAGDTGGAMFNTMPPASAPGVIAPPVPTPAQASTSQTAVDQTGRPAPVAAAPAPAAPAGPPMASSAQSKTSSDTEYKGISAQDRANLSNAKSAEKSAMEAEFAAKPTTKDAEDTEATAQAIEDIDERQAEREEAQRNYSDAMRAKLDSTADSLSKMKVDPNYFGRLDTGNKLLAGVSLMLGALGQGDKQNNPGMEIIQKAIDRDVDAQKANILNAKGAYEAQKGGYEQFLKASNDERLATISETQRQYDVLKSSLMGNAAGNVDAATAAAKQKALADIDAKYAALEAEKSGIIEKKSQSGEVSTGSPKLQETPPEEAKAQAETERIIAELRSIRDATKEAEGKSAIGPQARLAAIARALGMDEGEDATAIQARLTQYTASKLHDLTGRVTPAETAIMEKSFPSVHDNPKIFNRLLDQELSNAERNLQQRRAQWAGHSGLPNQTITVSPNNSAIKSQVGFKK